jgi:tetratricopeptide (TPR) repeat protein
MRNIIIVLFLSLPLLSLNAQSKEEKAYQIGTEAVKLMDKGQIQESIALLQDARELDPKSFIYPYEIAYALCLDKNYEDALKILKKLEKHKDASDLLYQMMGNCYDYLGDSKEAVKTYERGLKKFPNSGCLYLELGNMQMDKGENYAALSYFEKGIEVEPTFPSNYYWAAKIYLNTEDEVWGMMYGELFMNLERNSKRTVEISKLLYDTYKNEIKILNDSTVSVSFCKYSEISSDNTKLSFGAGIYEPILMMSLPNTKVIDMSTLNKIRTNFLDIYYKRNLENIYPNALMAYQKKIKDAGYINAYNHWILMQGDTEGFLEWKSANENEWKNFMELFSNNPIKLTPKNKFVKDQY